MSFIFANEIFNFFVYYINGVIVNRYKNNKTYYKRLQKITDRLLEQKPFKNAFLLPLALSKLQNVKHA